MCGALPLDEYRLCTARGSHEPIGGYRQGARNARPRDARDGVLGGEVDGQVDVVGTGLPVDVARGSRIEFADTLRGPRIPARREGRTVAITVCPVPGHRRESHGCWQAKKGAVFDVRANIRIEVGIEPDDHPAVGLHVVDAGIGAKAGNVDERNRLHHDRIPWNRFRWPAREAAPLEFVNTPWIALAYPGAGDAFTRSAAPIGTGSGDHASDVNLAITNTCTH